MLDSKFINHFHFMGVSEQSSTEDIKKAYRKLSLKYHPDKNPNDAYFIERFRELQRCYAILINDETRAQHLQQIKTAHQALLQNSLYELGNKPPYIKSFSANTTLAKKGDSIVLKWITQNADVVKLIPYGLVNGYGDRTINISEFINGEASFLLHAYNSKRRQSVVEKIIIKNAEINTSNSANSTRREKSKITQTSSKKNLYQGCNIFWWILIFAIIFAFVYYIIS